MIWQLVNGKYEVINTFAINSFGSSTSTDELVLKDVEMRFRSTTPSSIEVELQVLQPIQNVQLQLIDMNGRQLHVLSQSMLNNGRHLFELSTPHLPQAVYILRLTTGKRQLSRNWLFIIDPSYTKPRKSY